MNNRSYFSIKIYLLENYLKIFEGYFAVEKGYIVEFYDLEDLTENIFCGERDGGGGQDSRFNVQEMIFSQRGTNITKIPYFKKLGDNSKLFNLFDINNYQGIDCFSNGIKKVNFHIERLEIII